MGPLEEESDNKLAELAGTGSAMAFRVLVGRYQGYIFSLIARQLQDRAPAEELCQDVFIRAYRALPSFKGDSSFKTWLTRIALNHTSSYFKSRHFLKERRTIPIDIANYEDGIAIEHDPVHQRQIIASFIECYEDLDERMRQALSLCALQGEGYEDAAQVLEIPVGTIRSRINRARLLLRNCLLNKGVEL
jgi:RNA polymerase sigma-70 factor (ECF subfamily)